MGAGGKTAEEIWNGLNFQSKDRLFIADMYSNYLNSTLNNPFLNIANAIFVQEGVIVSDEFKELATHKFDSSAQTVNFAETKEAADKINDWVYHKTHGLIYDPISSDSFDAQTKMVLMNALSFKADWEIPFHASNNIKEPFHTADGKSENSVEMMTMTDFLQYTDAPEIDAKVLKLKYSDNNTTMVFILPNAVDGLASLGSKINFVGASAFRNMLRDTPYSDRSMVNVHLPKFNVEIVISLKSVLKKVICISNYHILLIINS